MRTIVSLVILISIMTCCCFSQIPGGKGTLPLPSALIMNIPIDEDIQSLFPAGIHPGRTGPTLGFAGMNRLQHKAYDIGYLTIRMTFMFDTSPETQDSIDVALQELHNQLRAFPMLASIDTMISVDISPNKTIRPAKLQKILDRVSQDIFHAFQRHDTIYLLYFEAGYALSYFQEMARLSMMRNDYEIMESVKQFSYMVKDILSLLRNSDVELQESDVLNMEKLHRALQRDFLGSEGTGLVANLSAQLDNAFRR